GAMGVVYAAHDPELGRRVAIKLLRPDVKADEYRARLTREAKALARLSHPNVVAVYDAGYVDGRFFIAMEYVDGETLTDWLSTPRPWQETLAMLLQAGHGLLHAHALDIVHRDFKPSNVLVGRDGRARVADFGLARWRQGDVAATAASAGSPSASGLV